MKEKRHRLLVAEKERHLLPVDEVEEGPSADGVEGKGR